MAVWTRLGVVFAVFLAVTVCQKLPIGGLFDKDNAATLSAYRSRFFQLANLKSDTLNLTMSDSYTLYKAMCRLMSHGVFAIIGSHDMMTLNDIRTDMFVYHVPFVTTGQAVNVSGQAEQYITYMAPHLADCIISVMRRYNWYKVHYLYDSDDGMTRMQQIIDTLMRDEYDMQVYMHRVGKGVDHVHHTLINLTMNWPDDTDDKHILLDIPVHQVEELLIKQKTDTRRTNFHYFAVQPGITELTLRKYSHGGVNLTGLQLVDYNNISHKSVFDNYENLDANVYPGAGPGKRITHEGALAIDAITVLDQAMAKIKLEHPTIIASTLRGGRFINNGSDGINCESDPTVPFHYGPLIHQAIREVETTGLTGHIAFDDNGLRTYTSVSVHDMTLNRGLAKIATWTKSRGLLAQAPSKTRIKGAGIATNRTRTVTTILSEPYLMLKEGVSESGEELSDPNERYTGYCAEMAKQLADMLKINYIIKPVKDGKYGSKDENNTWNGMVGELVREEADMAIAPLTITSEREKVIDFSKPFMSLGISIMIKKPDEDVPGVFSFMKPLSYEIWMCVIFAYIGVSVVLFLVSRFSPFEWHIEDNTDGPTVTNNFTIFNSLWFSLGAFMQQGCDIEPRSMSGRVVGSVWWFFTLIVISSYTANLAAFLTVSRMQSPIESAEDLAKQTEIKYGSVESGSTQQFFRSSTIAVYERMWAFMSSAQPPVWVGSNQEGVDKVRKSKGRYAFLAESTTNDYINNRKPCDTMKVGNNLDSKGYGIGTPIGSDLRDLITLAVLELREKGDLQKLQKKWWYGKGECGTEKSGKKKDATSALKLSGVAGVFYILVGGLVLALVMAVIEFIYKSRVEARRRKTSFSNAVRSKARLSIKGKPERQTTAVGAPDMPLNASMSTYKYEPAAQLISLDGYADGNTHTQV